MVTDFANDVSRQWLQQKKSMLIWYSSHANLTRAAHNHSLRYKLGPLKVVDFPYILWKHKLRIFMLHWLDIGLILIFTRFIRWFENYLGHKKFYKNLPYSWENNMPRSNMVSFDKHYFKYNAFYWLTIGQIVFKWPKPTVIRMDASEWETRLYWCVNVVTNHQCKFIVFYIRSLKIVT